MKRLVYADSSSDKIVDKYITKKFLSMDRGDAVTYILDVAHKLNQSNYKDYTSYNIENIAFDLIYAWNDANPEVTEIQGYEVDDPNFNDGEVYAIGIEDDSIVLADYIDDYKKYQDSLV